VDLRSPDASPSITIARFASNGSIFTSPSLGA
jgi:hypothetical protein